MREDGKRITAQLSRMITGTTRNIHCYRLAHAGIQNMLLDSLTGRFVRQLFSDLRQVGLTVGLLAVGEQCRSFLYHVTAATESISGGSPLGWIDIGLGEHPAAQ